MREGLRVFLTLLAMVQIEGFTRRELQGAQQSSTVFPWSGYWSSGAINQQGCIPLDPISITTDPLTGELTVSLAWPAGGTCAFESMTGGYVSPLIAPELSLSIPPDGIDIGQGRQVFSGTTFSASNENVNSFLYSTDMNLATLAYYRMSNLGFNWTGTWTLTNPDSNAYDCIPTEIQVTDYQSLGEGYFWSWQWPADAPNGPCTALQLNGTYDAYYLVPLTTICAPVSGSEAGCYNFVSNSSNPNQFTLTTGDIWIYQKGFNPQPKSAILLKSLFIILLAYVVSYLM